MTSSVRNTLAVVAFGWLAAGRAPAAAVLAGAAESEPAAVPEVGRWRTLHLILTPAKTTAYVGERIALGATLFVGRVPIRDLKTPVILVDSMTIDTFTHAEQGDSVRDGEHYLTISRRTLLTPLRPGRVEVGASIGMNVVTSHPRGVDPLFDPFIPSPVKPLEVRAEPIEITVLPLPEQGKPGGFAGAVGRFVFSLTATPTTVDAGEPITVRMAITGSGNLDALRAPALELDDRFRTYRAEPVTSEDRADHLVFEQVVIPRVVGVHTLPTVRFSFFDPEVHAYQTLTRGPLVLTVRAARAPAPRIIETNRPEN